MTRRMIVVAGTGSGVGKTTVTLGLLEAYRGRGLTVQAFKVGPDFIDPGLHEVVTGRPSYNLDGWMCGRDGVLNTVARHAAGADLVIVEGVMGCFDGADATGEDGSTAQVAKWLHAPAVLVIDVAGQSRSAAAVGGGFERFDGDLDVAGAVARGHEFHSSTLDAVPERVARVYRLEDGRGGDRAEGYLIHRALLSYVHLHFASNPELPRAFVAACADAR